MTISKEDIPECDEIKVKILVKPETKINFERGNMIMLHESLITGTNKAILSAEYLGKGVWAVDKEIPLRPRIAGSD